MLSWKPFLWLVCFGGLVFLYVRVFFHSFSMKVVNGQWVWKLIVATQLSKLDVFHFDVLLVRSCILIVYVYCLS